MRPGNAPAEFVALSTTLASPVVGDTALTGEYAVAGGGLIGKLAPWAHTAGVASYTLTPVYTVNGSDTGLPRTITGIGVFQSITANLMIFETLLPSSAVLSAIGDQLTVSEVVAQ